MRLLPNYLNGSTEKSKIKQETVPCFMDTLRLCRDCADTILADDPNLDKPENQPLLTETQDLFRRCTT